MESKRYTISVRFTNYYFGGVQVDTLEELVEVLNRKRVTKFAIGYNSPFSDTEYITVSDLTPETLTQKQFDWLIEDSLHNLIINRNFPINEFDIIR